MIHYKQVSVLVSHLTVLKILPLLGRKLPAGAVGVHEGVAAFGFLLQEAVNDVTRHREFPVPTVVLVKEFRIEFIIEHRLNRDLFRANTVVVIHLKVDEQFPISRVFGQALAVVHHLGELRNPAIRLAFGKVDLGVLVTALAEVPIFRRVIVLDLRANFLLVLIVRKVLIPFKAKGLIQGCAPARFVERDDEVDLRISHRSDDMLYILADENGTNIVAEAGVVSNCKRFGRRHPFNIIEDEFPICVHSISFCDKRKVDFDAGLPHCSRKRRDFRVRLPF